MGGMIMKKIMFNDEFRLTQAVLDGRKTMTRRIIKCPRTFRGEWVAGFNIHRSPSDKKIVGFPCMYDADEREFDMGEILPKYKLGEVVAIAQSYESVYNEKGLETMDMLVSGLKNHKGWQNKLFVAAGYMIHHIRITDIKIERLQDISDEDCLKEGIVKQEVISDESPLIYAYDAFLNGESGYFASQWFKSPKEAFAVLIDKVSGKGTWESNPFVFAYEFVLVD